MSNDHFVAQTYLRHFGDPSTGGMLHAYRKRDGKTFRCWPKDVFHEWDGDQNRLLQHSQLLGDFRKMIEPWWNPSVATLLRGNMTYHDKFVVAGYLANLMTCTPAWRRVGVTMVEQSTRAQLSFAKRMKLKHGGQPKLNVEAVEALENGKLAIDVEPDYIKGLATKNLMQYTWIIYNLDWEVLLNDSAVPFLTSDNPCALSYSGSPHESVRRILPITPQLAVTMQFDPRSKPAAERVSQSELGACLQRPPRGSITFSRCSGVLATSLNVIQARSAEELVFSSIGSDEIHQLVRDAARFRMDVRHVEFPDPSGEPDAIITGSILSVREHQGVASARNR